MNPLRVLRHFRASRLQMKVLGLVAAAMAVAVAVSVGALTRVYTTTKVIERISREDFETQLGIARALSAFRAEKLAWKDLLLKGKAGGDAALDSFNEQQALAEDMARGAGIATDDPQIRQRLDDFSAKHKALGERYRRAAEQFRAGSLDAASAEKEAGAEEHDPGLALQEADALAQESGSKAIVRAVEEAALAYKVAIAAIAAATVLGLTAVWLFMRRSVLNPILAAGGYAERIAGGDLTAEIHGTSRDEAGQLLEALARMNAGLSEVVSQVRTSAESVVKASDDVAAGTTDLSQRTEEQASSLEETAASMEQLSGTVRQNADNAREADELALNASKRAEQGGREVARVVATMSEISDGAKRISDIISVIDGIAFQTNILALNAAVEAARAGEQGRGFAVVAAEVRSLAQRSADAAKEIKALIGASVAEVDNGTKLVDQAGATISELVGDVKRVSGLMRSIAEASAEQSRGVQQVNKTVTEMDRVVQQNAAAVQASAASADAMRRQAEALLRAVSTFRIGHGSPATALAARVSLAQASAHEAPLAAPQPVARAPKRAPAAPPPAPGKESSDDWEEF